MLNATVLIIAKDISFKFFLNSKFSKLKISHQEIWINILIQRKFKYILLKANDTYRNISKLKECLNFLQHQFSKRQTNKVKELILIQ